MANRKLSDFTPEANPIGAYEVPMVKPNDADVYKATIANMSKALDSSLIPVSGFSSANLQGALVELLSLTNGAVLLQGDWDATLNSPDITGTAVTGHAWRVSVSGSTDLGGINQWNVGDLAVKTAAGWIKIDNEDISAVWGNISGTLANQTDLQAALDSKFNNTGGVLSGPVETQTVRITGAFAYSDGEGIEFLYSGGAGVVAVINRSTSALNPMQIFGSQFVVYSGPTTNASIASFTIDSSGNANFTVSLSVQGNPVVTSTTLSPSIKANQPELSGSFVISDVVDLENAALSFDATSITLREGVNYQFRTIVSIGSKKIVMNGASLSASIPAASGVLTSGGILFESSDNSVSIGDGFLCLGDPSGSTALFSLQNPTETRNSFIFRGVALYNNSRSNINGFESVLIAGAFNDSSDRIDFDLVNAVDVELQTMRLGDAITANRFINMPTEGGTNLGLKVVACKVRPLAGLDSIYINNTTRSAKSINVSGNECLGDGALLAGPQLSDDNYLTQGNVGLPTTRLTGEAYFFSEVGAVTAVTQNVWTPIDADLSIKSGSIGTQLSAGLRSIKVSRPVKGESIRVRFTVSADVSGVLEVVCAARIVKSSDNGVTWSEISVAPRFTTRQTAGAITVETPDICNQGDMYRGEIINFSSNESFNIYTSLIQIL